jgi:hypothetical protein
MWTDGFGASRKLWTATTLHTSQTSACGKGLQEAFLPGSSGKTPCWKIWSFQLLLMCYNCNLFPLRYLPGERLIRITTSQHVRILCLMLPIRILTMIVGALWSFLSVPGCFPPLKRIRTAAASCRVYLYVRPGRRSVLLSTLRSNAFLDGRGAVTTGRRENIEFGHANVGWRL